MGVSQVLSGRISCLASRTSVTGTNTVMEACTLDKVGGNKGGDEGERREVKGRVIRGRRGGEKVKGRRADGRRGEINDWR